MHKSAVLWSRYHSNPAKVANTIRELLFTFSYFMLTLLIYLQNFPEVYLYNKAVQNLS